MSTNTSPGTTSTVKTQDPSEEKSEELWPELSEAARSQREKPLCDAVHDKTTEGSSTSGDESQETDKDESKNNSDPKASKSSDAASEAARDRTTLFPGSRKKVQTRFLLTGDLVKTRDEIYKDSHRAEYNKACSDGSLEQVAGKDLESVTAMQTFGRKLLSMMPAEVTRSPGDAYWAAKSHLERDYDDKVTLARRACIVAWATKTLIDENTDTQFVDATEASVKAVSSKLHPDDPLYAAPNTTTTSPESGPADK